MNRFGEVLANARRARSWSQADLADAVGVSQAQVSYWESGDKSPEVERAFAIEAALEVAPGFLTRHLGYLPVGAEPLPCAVVDAITADPLLDETGRRVLLGVYGELTDRTGRRR